MTPRLQFALLLAFIVPTAAPLAFILLGGLQAQPSLVMTIMGLLGILHSGATSQFHLDGLRQYSTARMIWVPAALIGLAAAVFSIGGADAPALFPFYFAVHYIWLLWHLGRQNFGLACASGHGSRDDRDWFDFTACAAIPAAITIYFPGLSAEQATALHVLSYGLGCFATIWMFDRLTTREVRQSWPRVVAVASGLVFWLPTVLSAGTAVGPALALTFFSHPIMYLIVVGARGTQRGRLIVLGTGIISIGLFVILTATAGTIVGLALAFGITQAHFLIDGEVWRGRGAGAAKMG